MLPIKLSADSSVDRIVTLQSRRCRLTAHIITMCAIAWVAFAASTAHADTTPLSQQMAQSVLQNWPHGHYSTDQGEWKWDYRLGTVLNGMDAVWHNTADPAYYDYVKTAVDQFVQDDGSIRTYNAKDDSLDSVLLGQQLLMLYAVTQDAKYYKAAKSIRDQLATQPRNPSGGFWHQGQTPNQMWLDGLYMAEPFYAEYASMFQEPKDFADITRQFVLIDQHARDPKTGLLYHGWDESKQQPWADKATGDSPSFWARATGWYMMALVDTLPYVPPNDPGRAKLIAILNRTATAVARVQEARTGLWYEVLNQPLAKGNYFESSAACMFTYAFAKGVRLGYLPPSYAVNAARGYRGILQSFVQNNPNGSLTISDTVSGTALGGNAHNDGSYSYYISVPKISGDPRGVGAFLLASSEMELAPAALTGAGTTVMMDAWYNSQQRTNAAGQKEYFHYKWKDQSNSGFSFLGHVFRSYGLATKTLYSAPTVENLKHAQIYMIVSPDIPSKNPNPHYMQPKDATQVAAWVRRGGVLVMMENDGPNADIEHLDLLADKFGIHFDNVLFHHVIGQDLQAGRLAVSGDSPVVPGSHIFYMKDTCTIHVHKPAFPLLTQQGTIMMAGAKYGRGMVLAVVDPWVYNEYVDGHNHNLPSEYDNFSGAREMVQWLIDQVSEPLPAPIKASATKAR